MLVAGTALVALTGSAGADEQHFPLQSYRVGPYAAGGTGFFGGFIDYLNLINTRDGGVNGVKLTWSEGETQYEVERGVEVYERLKSRPASQPGTRSLWESPMRWSTGSPRTRCR